MLQAVVFQSQAWEAAAPCVWADLLIPGVRAVALIWHASGRGGLRKTCAHTFQGMGCGRRCVGAVVLHILTCRATPFSLGARPASGVFGGASQGRWVHLSADGADCYAGMLPLPHHQPLHHLKLMF